MLRIRRLNMDTSWELEWHHTTLILDPWLVGSEVDGFSWFNEQWHTTPPISVEKLTNYQGLLVSQSYSDHCHEQTLELLIDAPIFCTPKATKRLRKSSLEGRLRDLPDFEGGEWEEIGAVKVAYLHPGRKMDPVYYGLIFVHGSEAVLYTPHGFEPSAAQLELIKQYQVSLLITSFSLFRLPGFMGGDVNPGVARARALVEQIQPGKVVHTHDEQKHARGLVSKLAKVVYPDFEQLKKDFPGRFVYLGEDYRYLTIAEGVSQD